MLCEECEMCVDTLDSSLIQSNFPNIISLDIEGCEMVAGEPNFKIMGCNYKSG